MPKTYIIKLFCNMEISQVMETIYHNKCT